MSDRSTLTDREEQFIDYAVELLAEDPGPYLDALDQGGRPALDALVEERAESILRAALERQEELVIAVLTRDRQGSELRRGLLAETWQRIRERQGDVS